MLEGYGEIEQLVFIPSETSSEVHVRFVHL